MTHYLPTRRASDPMGNAGRNGGEYYTPRPLIRAMIKVVKPTLNDTVYDGAAGSCGFLCEAYDYLRPMAKTAGDLERLQKRTFRSEEHTSELQSLMRISYAVFCLKNKNNNLN